MKKLRMGIVGGGKGSFIGMVHRTAATMDGLCELVCGVFSRDNTINRNTGSELGLPADRVYSSFHQMIKIESTLPDSEKMDFIVIATPNNSHFEIAKAAIENGFHVVSDKPATFSVDECKQLKALVLQSRQLYCLTHVYTGFPLVKEARQKVINGELGSIRKITVEYSQDWLTDQSCESSKQAIWRLNPEQSGISCCIGDIGIHASNLAEYISGLQVTHLCSDMDNIVNGRTLDDDAHILLKFNHNVKGVLIASQAATGEENNLNIRVYGDKASIEWRLQDPNKLYLKPWSQPVSILTTGSQYLSLGTLQNCRIPAGHSEGYLEAFANIYRNFFQHLNHLNSAQTKAEFIPDYPGIEEAMKGMNFIQAAVDSGKSDSKWHVIKND